MKRKLVSLFLICTTVLSSVVPAVAALPEESLTKEPLSADSIKVNTESIPSGVLQELEEHLPSLMPLIEKRLAEFNVSYDGLSIGNGFRIYADYEKYYFPVLNGSEIVYSIEISNIDGNYGVSTSKNFVEEINALDRTKEHLFIERDEQVFSIEKSSKEVHEISDSKKTVDNYSTLNANSLINTNVPDIVEIKEINSALFSEEAIASLAVSTRAVTYDQIPMNIMTSQRDNDCWACASASVIQVMTSGRQNPNPSNICDNVHKTTSHATNKRCPNGGTGTDMVEALKYYGVSATATTGTNMTIKSKIRSRKPVIADLFNIEGGLGHAVVISGYVLNNGNLTHYTVLDNIRSWPVDVSVTSNGDKFRLDCYEFKGHMVYPN